MRNAPTISRRSTAIGCRRAMVVTAFSSISRCSASTSIVRRYDTSGERGVALHQGFGRGGDLLVVEAPHVRNLTRKLLQVGIKSPSGMYRP